jgi:hypothetical protein
MVIADRQVLNQIARHGAAATRCGRVYDRALQDGLPLRCIRLLLDRVSDRVQTDPIYLDPFFLASSAAFSAARVPARIPVMA